MVEPVGQKHEGGKDGVQLEYYSRINGEMETKNVWKMREILEKQETRSGA